MRLRGRGRGSVRGWLLLALVVAVIVLQLPPLHGLAGRVRESILPVTAALAQAGRFIEAHLSRLGATAELQREVERLRQENARLEAENARLAELERQNAFLLGALGFKQQHADLSFIAAEIVSYEPTNLARAVTVNRGQDDGVRPGAVIMTPRGVVGQVTKVTARSAVALLIIDPRSAVDTRAQQSGARGIVTGLGRPDLLLMRYVRQEQFLYLSERVVTSGLGGVFPAGLPIGTVAYVQRRDVDAFQEAYLEPAVDFTRLGQVLVLVDERQDTARTE
jgi:rod shape-determining protein MreC